MIFSCISFFCILGPIVNKMLNSSMNPLQCLMHRFCTWKINKQKWSAKKFSLFYFNNITKSFIVPSLLTEGNLNEVWYKNVAHLYHDKQKWNTKLCESSQISNVKTLTQKNSYCWFSEKGIYLFSTNHLILGLRNKLLTRWNNPTITIKEYQAIFVSKLILHENRTLSLQTFSAETELL